MKLGLTLGYWGAQPPTDALEKILEAERLGYDAVFTAESWGSDAFGPLAWWGSQTSRIRLGTSIVQISARTPTSCAMHALTLDHLSGGRLVLGLGVSGPQVVEGWYGGPFGKPLARTREYIDVIRQVLRREAPGHQRRPAPPAPLRRRRARSASASRCARSPTRCGPTSRSGSAPRARRTWRWPARSPTAGCRSTTRRRSAAMYQGWLDEGFAKRDDADAAAAALRHRARTARWW